MVNGNHEITAQKQGGNFFSPPPGLEPLSPRTESQCASNELRWPCVIFLQWGHPPRQRREEHWQTGLRLQQFAADNIPISIQATCRNLRKRRVLSGNLGSNLSGNLGSNLSKSKTSRNQIIPRKNAPFSWGLFHKLFLRPTPLCQTFTPVKSFSKVGRRRRA